MNKLLRIKTLLDRFIGECGGEGGLNEASTLLDAYILEFHMRKPEELLEHERTQGQSGD